MKARCTNFTLGFRHRLPIPYTFMVYRKAPCQTLADRDVDLSAHVYPLLIATVQ